MRYGTVCSGIEAPSVAWEPMGWEPQFFSEIEKFPKAVLAHHYPNVPDVGDMTNTEAFSGFSNVDLLIGGTPCQSFSVAGLRKGLDDPRGNLALVYLAIAHRLRPRWLVWENVPGVLSSSGGRDFGAFLGALGELGYGFAGRVLDAQYVRVDGFARAVPQRRRRVFVVGCLGGWASAGAVLFEPESLSGNPAPRRTTGEVSADDVAGCLGKSVGVKYDLDGHVAYITSPAMGFDPGQSSAKKATTQLTIEASPPLIKARSMAVAFHPRQDPISGDVAPPSETKGPMAVAFAENSRQELRLEGGDGGRTGALTTGGGKPGQGVPMAIHGPAVRRLTPVECERLQGFPDNYTRIPWRGKAPEDCPDGPRYKALGNSMAVNVVRWIGRRIEMVDGITNGIEV